MNSSPDNENPLDWWNALRHGGMLVDPTRLTKLISNPPPRLSFFETDRLRRRIVSFEQDENAGRSKFVGYVFESICGFASVGIWDRGTSVDPSRWTRRTIAGEDVKPNHLWRGPHNAILPVFVDSDKRVGVGRGKRAVTAAIQWLRGGEEKLAVVTNGRQWRLVMAGLDYEAFCEWDIDRWLEGGETSAELFGLRALLHPPIWTPPASDDDDSAPSPLVAAIADSRKGQADLSAVLGERVRQAVEVLIQAHGPVLNQISSQSQSPPTNAEIYRAGVRLIMRLVVGLFAESREGLLPKDNPIFHECYSLSGLRDQLERISPSRRASSYSAFPRVVSLFRLIHDGSSHEALTVPGYGGTLFAPGQADSNDGVSRALHVLEQGCYEHEIISDAKIYSILDLLSRTKVKIRQGRSGTWVPAPVDFSSLDSEYIGILYEGLLDFELRVAGDDGPVIFLAVGNQPALPLSTLEAMDNKSLKNLLEKMKDTSSGDDEEESASEDESSDDETSETDSNGEGDEEDSDDETSDDAEDESADDVRHTARTAAESWAKRAIEVGKLVSPPRGPRTPEKQLAHQAAIDRKAKQIITKVVLPGERYLVRWGGTRKGSGTFYTRPQLAIPTVHRTLRPLAYESSALAAGDTNETDKHDAKVQQIPRRPEEILALKICDPACGSGSFPLAALRFLTDALYHSLVYHDRFKGYDDRTVIDLIRDTDNETTLADETLPCRPDDAEFEPRTKAVLRRYIVERCIYGVDLDPLAVELCRLSLWIETLDRRLPFTFLDHKIKCGNSLVGTWFDQFMHYPAMAWMREGGDKNHTDGVHFKKEGWTKSIRAKVKEVKKDLIDYIDGAKLIYKVDLSSIETMHDEAEKALAEMHSLGIHQSTERAERYAKLRGSESFNDLKFAFDLYCAMWYWPPEQIDDCPLPIDFYGNELTDDAKQLVNELSEKHRFFHWEVEYPDVFNQRTLGFDAVLGNPPWETLQPNSKEYFSAIDPLYRSYGNQEAKRHQRSYFYDSATESDWLRYNGFYKELANWMKFSGTPFGNQQKSSSSDKQEHQFPIGSRGKASFESSEARHVKWAQKREETSGYADTDHAFRHQGGGKPYTHKMFLEVAHAIAREGGRLGLIVPSGLYSDHGTQSLRALFIDHCQWEWLFGFENREGIFDIHRSFKFNPIIVEKGGRTESIQTAFMRRSLSDWENGERYVTEYPRERVLQFSPSSRAILEIQSGRDLEVLEKIYSGSVLLGDDGPDGWGIKFAQGDFNMTSDSKLFPPRTWWEERGYIPDEYSRWIKGKWQPRTATSPAPLDCKRLDIPTGVFLSRDGEQYIHEEDIATDEFKDKKKQVVVGKAVGFPLSQGVMIHQRDLNYKHHLSGVGAQAAWEKQLPSNKSVVTSQYLMPSCFYSVNYTSPRIAYRRIARTTDSRTWIGTAQLQSPSGDSIFLLNPRNPWDSIYACAFLSSFWFDWIIRQRLGGTNLSWYMLAENACVKSEIARQRIELEVLGIFGRCNFLSGWWLRVEQSAKSLFSSRSISHLTAMTEHDRLRKTCILNAVSAYLFGLSSDDCKKILLDCDLPSECYSSDDNLDSRGFWRVDKGKDAELRETVLSLVALADLESLSNNSLSTCIESFLTQNQGEGWQLPETLRLADYGLGHDERAKQSQPVRECFGPRFYDWQLAQTPEESWAECHLHARNLLGQAAYEQLVCGDASGDRTDHETNSTVQEDEPFQLTGDAPTRKRRR